MQNFFSTSWKGGDILSFKERIAHVLLGLPLYAKVPDTRGWAWGVNLEWVDPMLKFKSVYTLAKKVRGGEIHPHEKIFVITGGEVELYTWIGGLDGSPTKRTITASDRGVRIPPETPHAFVFHQATHLVEWWPGSYRVEFPEPLRSQVEGGYDAFCRMYP